jgi:hypothetical protein
MVSFWILSKKGNRGNCEDYRGISSLYAVASEFWTIIKRRKAKTERRNVIFEVCTDYTTKGQINSPIMKEENILM